MELNYDWESFQAMFQPKRRSAARTGADIGGSVYVVAEGSTIISAFSECEDLADWIGADYQELATEMPHREVLILEREKADQWMVEATKLPHYIEQFDFLREKASAEVLSTRAKPAKKGARGRGGKVAVSALKHGTLASPHFFFEAIQGWWSKVFPSAYGVFVRLEGGSNPGGAQDFFILVRRGKIEAFHEPDLVSMGKDRRTMPAEVVKYLSEKHLVPVQGFFMPAQQWQLWSESPHPWKDIAASLKANQAKLVPFRFSLVTLIASRAFLGA